MGTVQRPSSPRPDHHPIDGPALAGDHPPSRRAADHLCAGSAPTGTVSINNGAVWARSPVVGLTRAAADDTGVTELCVSNTTTCTSHVAYTTSLPWTLAAGGTTRTVYATFRDAAGNLSGRTSDTIRLDAVAPTPGVISASSSAPRTVALAWSGYSDALAGITTYRVVRSAPNGATPASCTTGTVVTNTVGSTAAVSALTSGASYGFRVCAIDAAGNMDAGASATESVL